MNYGLLMVGVIVAATGVGLLVRETVDRKGTPLTGTVVGNMEYRGHDLTREYRPRIEYQNPVTGELDVITPWQHRNSKWEIGSTVDLVFIESLGKARYDYKMEPALALSIAAVGAALLSFAFIW